MKISEPAVVGVSQPGENRWGHFQFPTISRLPDGQLMVTANNADDATAGYGHCPRRFVSGDGEAWRPADPGVPGGGPHAACAELFAGEYMVLPSAKTFDTAAAGLRLPEPVGTAFAYIEFYYRRVDDCPPALRDYLTRIDGWRWTPACPQWTPERVTYDVPGQICWTLGKELTVARTWFERRPIHYGDELLYVDYRTNCLRADGSVPQGFSCILMASQDNGRSFHKRGVVAEGRMYEPMVAQTRGGGLACVIRGADQEQRPMLISHSSDGGRSWEPPHRLFDFGVFPAILRLDNGVLLLSFGRPGVWVSASLDGTGRTWTEPVPVIRGDHASIQADTCGYTDLLATGPDEATLVYSNFKYRLPDGQGAKSIETRRIRVTAQP